MPQVAEYRFHGKEASAVLGSTFWAVDAQRINTEDIVRVSRIEAEQVEQMIQRWLKSARQSLPLQVHRKKFRAGVDVFVTRYLLAPISPSASTLIFVLVHGTMWAWINFFYSVVSPYAFL